MKLETTIYDAELIETTEQETPGQKPTDSKPKRSELMTRTIETNYYNLYGFNDGELELLCVIHDTGKRDDKKAKKQAIKNHGDEILIKWKKTEQAVYELSIDDFMKYATKREA